MGEREEQIVARLVSKLKDGDIAASDLLYRLSPQEFLEPLANRLNYEPDEEIRWRITCRLGTMGDRRVVGVLAETLKEVSRYGRKCETAGRILSKLDPGLAEKLLIELLTENDENIRLFATAQLGRIGSESALAHVAKMLKDSDSTVRRFAKRALDIDDRKRPSRSVDVQTQGDEAERYIAELKSENSHTRYNAAGMLHDIGDERAIEPLIAMLNDEVGEVRYVTVFALERVGDARTLPALQWIAEHDEYEDFEERKISDAARQAIAHIKTREYILTGKEL